MAQASDIHLYVLTHVMEIRRVDHGDFDVDAVERLLDCLRLTFSFAFGRWVAPVVPVGYDPAGNVAWELWTSPICDPADRFTDAMSGTSRRPRRTGPVRRASLQRQRQAR